MSTQTPVELQASVDAWQRYSVVHQNLMSHLARVLQRATGLSEADYQVLDALLDAPGHRARALELRWTLQWEKSRLSHQLRRMAGRGLVERHTCTVDGRGADVVLTDAGRAAGQQARRVRNDELQAIVLDTLGPEHIARLDEVATLLAKRLEAAAQEDPECRAVRDAVLDGGGSDNTDD